MKYALSILGLSFFVSTYSSIAHARSITSFGQSDAISAVADFMYDVGEDIPVSTRMTDKKINIKDLSKCTTVTSEEVVDDVSAAIRTVMRFYPDEDIPFEAALADMEDYLDHQVFKKCILIKRRAHSLVRSSYYLNSEDKIHLRLDNIALTPE
ncbi:hypothetical protein SHI21_08865 [Bacteriovorax sp. PP10]|uniref:Uncharacterized protein n=1 Tax=Bacteriovorax antarcticus TaxID=3088717 RepID=A0ABU5VTI9_9BACT|nr:hypothetical protein [Bacteriovorax sp. PP10]MEA9356311.1 hypothetical protein [Bacteriovorax sp. PP10]